MTDHVAWETLNDHADGRLSPADHERVAQHLASCPECAALHAKLQQVLASARTSAGSVEPPAEAWHAIRREIDLSKVVPLPTATLRPRAPRIAVRIAAAVLLMAGSSLVTVAVMTGRKNTPAGGESPAGNVTPVSLVEIEGTYAAELQQLTTVLEESRSKLAPETVAAVERSLRVIDDAIAEARAAVLRDPASALLKDMLSRSYEQKVDLLRRVSERVRTT